MTKTKLEQHRYKLTHKILNAAAKRFLKNGYTETSIKSITSDVGISTGSFNNIFQTKEDVLCTLVEYVLAKQFSVAGELLKGKTEDKLLFYAVETTLQLHIVEMNENLRDVYSAAYSLPKSSAIIQRMITGKWENIFKEHLPHLETKDFYMLEIATGGIMRGFMTIPCDMWFTMEQKVQAFLKSTFKLYDVPKEKVRQALDFIKQFDFEAIARETIANIVKFLEEEVI